MKVKSAINVKYINDVYITYMYKITETIGDNIIMKNGEYYIRPSVYVHYLPGNYTSKYFNSDEDAETFYQSVIKEITYIEI